MRIHHNTTTAEFIENLRYVAIKACQTPQFIDAIDNLNELVGLENDLEESGDKIAELEDEIIELKDSIKDAVEELKTAEDKIDIRDAEIEALETERIELLEEIDALKGRLGELPSYLAPSPK